VLTQS